MKRLALALPLAVALFAAAPAQAAALLTAAPTVTPIVNGEKLLPKVTTPDTTPDATPDIAKVTPDDTLHVSFWTPPFGTWAPQAPGYDMANPDGLMYVINQGETEGQAAEGIDFVYPATGSGYLWVDATVSTYYVAEDDALPNCPWAGATSFGAVSIRIIDISAGNALVDSVTTTVFSDNQYCSSTTSQSTSWLTNYLVASIPNATPGHTYNLQVYANDGTDVFAYFQQESVYAQVMSFQLAWNSR